MAAFGLLALRLTLAIVLVSHGAHKLFGTFGGAGMGPGGLAATAPYFNGAGLEPGLPMALLAGILQLIGGALLGAGLLTRAAAASLAGYYVLEVWNDSAKWGFFLNWTLDPTRGHGWEFAFVLIGGFACLLLAGPGEWSIDGRRARRAASRAMGRSRLRGRS